VFVGMPMCSGTGCEHDVVDGDALLFVREDGVGPHVTGKGGTSQFGWFSLCTGIADNCHRHDEMGQLFRRFESGFVCSTGSLDLRRCDRVSIECFISAKNCGGGVCWTHLDQEVAAICESDLPTYREPRRSGSVIAFAMESDLRQKVERQNGIQKDIYLLEELLVRTKGKYDGKSSSSTLTRMAAPF